MRTPTLYQFFHHQIQHGFGKKGLAEPATVDYVSDILTRFAHTRSLYPFVDSEGIPVEHIADMLAEWYHAQGYDGGMPDRARQITVIRHIGEYSLFMSGLFREKVQARGQLSYYTAQGSNAFWRCADYETNPVRVHLFRRLYLNFSHIINALDHMRRVQFSYPLQAPPTAHTLLSSMWRA